MDGLSRKHLGPLTIDPRMQAIQAFGQQTSWPGHDLSGTRPNLNLMLWRWVHAVAAKSG